MQEVFYAYREDEPTISLLAQETHSEIQLSSIVSIRKREVSPSFTQQLFVLDIRGSQIPFSGYSDLAKTLVLTNDCHCYYARIDCQIEFKVKPRIMQKISEFVPCYTGTGLFQYYDGQPCGFLVLLRVFKSKVSIPEELFVKGRLGSAQIMGLFDNTGLRVGVPIFDELIPVVSDSSFYSTKEELIHILKLENSLIGVYGNDEESARLLRVKREIINGTRVSRKDVLREENDELFSPARLYDYSRTDYESLYREIISIDPELSMLIDYVKNVSAPQFGEFDYYISKAKAGEEFAKNRIFEMYMRNAIKIALQYYKRFPFDLAETIQEALMGLNTAINKYEIGSHGAFAAYFPWWVRQSIYRNAYWSCIPFTLPINYNNNLVTAYEIKKMHYCEKCNGKRTCPNLVREVETKCQIPEQEALFLLSCFDETISIESLLEIDPDFCHYDGDSMFFADTGTNPEAYSQRENNKAVINRIIESCLTEKEKEIIILRYGLKDGVPKSLDEIGSIYSVTRERIRQIEQKALRKFKANYWRMR